MSNIPPPELPILMGQNLTDKGCIPLTNVIIETAEPHNLSAVPAGFNAGCNATNTPGASFAVQPNNGWASFDFISTAVLQYMVLSIDNHPMWVYAVDGRYIEPQKVDVSNISSTIIHN
jgi:FtsP/CotA-like multicopper oxidase with cupredoxin domain